MRWFLMLLFPFSDQVQQSLGWPFYGSNTSAHWWYCSYQIWHHWWQGKGWMILDNECDWKVEWALQKEAEVFSVNRTWVDWPSSFSSSGGSCYFYDIHYKQTHRLCGHWPDLLWPTQSQCQGCGGCPHEGLTWLLPNTKLPLAPSPHSCIKNVL